MNEYTFIHHVALQGFAQALLEAAGVSSADAVLVSDSLVAADLRGVESHGVRLLPFYLEAMEIGNIKIHNAGRVVSESGGCLVYDGEDGIGQVIADRCVAHAVRLAKEHGLAVAVARESNHFGAAAYWAQKMSAAGMIGIVMCNATPLVAPWQGKEPRFGTNPICMSVPGPNTWLLDMATTTVAMNRIWKASYAGEPTLPPGWAMDKNGVPTTDTQAAVEGMPMPLGGYKGSGLAMMAEILCAVLSGGAMSTQLGGLRIKGQTMRTGQFFCAMDVARFMPVDDFADRMQWLRETVKNTAPAPGYDEVLVAGDPEWRAEQQRSHDGIPLGDSVWKPLCECAAKLGVPLPVITATKQVE